MFEHYRDAIQRMALEAYPCEGVLLITLAGARVVRNTDPDPENAFRISTADWQQAMAEGLLAVVHSHPDGPDCPSAADMQGQRDTAVPWGIVACWGGERCSLPFWWGEGVPTDPLIGRGFRHGVTDCYSLIRDYYQQELAIALPDFPRDWEWWRHGQQLYQQGFAEAGFSPVSQAAIRPHDVFLCQIRCDTPNHGGIYLGSGLALHHLTARDPVDASRISRREPISRWQNHITHVLRHHSLAGEP